jgi:outer membrane protein TolC
MAAFDQVTWAVGVELSWAPLGQAASAASLRATVEQRRAALARDDARREADNRARKLLSAVEAAVRRRELAQAAVDLARRAISAEQLRFSEGLVPAKNVMDRQVELAQTELRLARVETDLAVAHAELDALTGQNLERYGLR